MRGIRIAIALALLAALSITGTALAEDAAIKIVNKSSWAIHHLYLSPSDTEEWGPDQLGRDILEPDESLLLQEIECDVYDIMIVDEDGDECIIEGERLCAEDAIWNLTNAELLSCEGWTD